MADKFTLADFRQHMAMIARPSLMQKLLAMLPGMGALREAIDDFDDSELKGLLDIIDAMTPAERTNSKLLDRSRRERVAVGAGCTPREVDELVKQYEAIEEDITTLDGKSLSERRWYLERRETCEQKRPDAPRDEDGDGPPPHHPISPA